MNNTISNATSAYQNASNITKGSSSDNNSFSSMVGDVLDSTASSLRQAEKVSMNSLAGEVSMEELAISVANAEMSLRTVVAVRDRIISAYQDIIKMPI